MDHTHDAASWDRMYLHRHGHAPSGEPNPVLAEEIAGRPPGVALDLACGEGADAMWLARHGWCVTGVDFSNVALEHARASDPQGRVQWIHADFCAWQPPADAYDLVSLHYVHVPPAERPALFGRLAQAVRPNGMLLVVAHHPSDHETTIGRPAIADLFFTGDELSTLLPPDRWQILTSGTRPRTTTDPEGRAITLQDTVLKACRLR